MDQLIEVTIPRTQTRKKDNLFSSLYTVTITQVYEVKVVLDDSYEYILFKRYKEFRILHKNIKKLPTSQTLPKFPGKVINPMNPLTISKRKSALEKWLQVALSIKKAENFIKIFLNIKTELIDEISQLQKMSKDEYFVKEFCDKINSNLNSKVNIIETFTKNFFTKKRNISEEHLKTLVKTLILICADEYIGSKALDFLHKLLSSDHNREFGNYIKEMIKMPVKDLKKMKLDEYILNKRFCESQIQAFNVLNILYLSYDLESFQLILNSNNQALEVYEKWGKKEISVKFKALSSNIDWRPLVIKENCSDFNILFRLINNELQFNVRFIVESDLPTLISLLVVPEQRKKWDLRLLEMQEIPRHNDDIGLISVYSQDRTLYEFHSSVQIQRTLYLASIIFKNKSYPSITPKGLLSKMTSTYKLEYLTKKNPSFLYIDKENTIKKNSSCGDLIQDEIDKLQVSIKVNWNASFCESSKKMFIKDFIGESEVFKQSLMRFVCAAESRSFIEIDKTPNNAILEACERKKLRRIQSIRKMSAPDWENN